MSDLSISASVVDRIANSNLGIAYTANTVSNATRRAREKITNSAEVPLVISADVPGIFVIQNTSYDDVTTADGAAVVQWGIATGVYPFDLKVGESAVLRLSATTTTLTIYALSSIAATDMWLELQAWDN